MAFRKITEGDMLGKGNVGRPDTPGVSTAEMQRIMDELPREVLAPAFNELAGQLEAETAAADIGAAAPEGVTAAPAGKLQAVLNGLRDLVKAHTDRADNPHGVTAAQAGAYSKAETDAAISAKVVELGAGDMAKSIYDPGNEQQPLLPRNGDGSNVTAAFTEAEQDADIQTGEELTVLFGKIKKRFSAMLAAIADRYTKTEAEARFMPNPSLLDNSDFTNPVNQRGVSGTISTAGYFIDRWKLVSGTVQITAEGLVLNGTISQILENAAGTDVTASASAGTASYDNSTKTFTLTATGQTITWAKLEKGSVDTPYVPKGYGAELLACQRYYVPIGENTKFFGGIGTAGNVAFVGMILPVQMRVTPSFTSDLNVVLRTVQGEQNIHGPVISKMTENNLAFTVTLNSGTTKSTPCAGYFYNERGLSADL